MKKIVFFFIFSGFFFFNPLPIQGQKESISSAQLAERKIRAEPDYRCLRLYLFLKENSSPLTQFSGDFINAADVWGIDWRLLPAIAGLESSFGKRMVSETYNAYGWGGGYIKFKNWKQSIDYVSQKLRENYYNRGLTSPALIGPVYAPPNPRWGGLIALIMAKI